MFKTDRKYSAGKEVRWPLTLCAGEWAVDISVKPAHGQSSGRRAWQQGLGIPVQTPVQISVQIPGWAPCALGEGAGVCVIRPPLQRVSATGIWRGPYHTQPPRLSRHHAGPGPSGPGTGEEGGSAAAQKPGLVSLGSTCAASTHGPWLLPRLLLLLAAAFSPQAVHTPCGAPFCCCSLPCGRPLSFPLRMEGWPSQLLAFLRLSALDASAPDSVLEELAGEVASAEANIMAALRKGVPRGGTWPLAVEIAAMEALVASCQVALGGYQTTLQVQLAHLPITVPHYGCPCRPLIHALPSGTM